MNVGGPSSSETVSGVTTAFDSSPSVRTSTAQRRGHRRPDAECSRARCARSRRGTEPLTRNGAGQHNTARRPEIRRSVGSVLRAPGICGGQAAGRERTARTQLRTLGAATGAARRADYAVQPALPAARRLLETRNRRSPCRAVPKYAVMPSHRRVIGNCVGQASKSAASLGCALLHRSWPALAADPATGIPQRVPRARYRQLSVGQRRPGAGAGGRGIASRLLRVTPGRPLGPQGATLNSRRQENRTMNDMDRTG